MPNCFGQHRLWRRVCLHPSSPKSGWGAAILQGDAPCAPDTSAWKLEEGWFGTVEGEIQTATRGTLQGLLFFCVFTWGPIDVLVDNKFTYDGFRTERFANPAMGQAHADIWASPQRPQWPGEGFQG